jgi:tetratricopeptide (TPR) repeat protein
MVICKMTSRGGISTLKGVQYEVRAVLYEMPDLLNGRLAAIRYQPASSSLSASQPPTGIFTDDYSTKDEYGEKCFFQVKQNTRDSSWTVRRLLDEGILRQFCEQYIAEPQSKLFFVSNIPAPQLQQLTDRARQTISPDEFQETLTKEMRKHVKQIIEALGVSWKDLHDLLKRAEHRLLTEEQIQKRITDYASGRYTDIGNFALAIKDLVEKSPGVLLTRNKVLGYLKNRVSSRHPMTSNHDILCSTGISLAKMPTTSANLFGREEELRMLDEAWESPETRVVSLVAWGGVGKTALVNIWLNQIGQDNYRGAERVFGWSFYNQGAVEGKQTSADQFIAAALKWFGDPKAANSSMSSWAKGERLAELVRKYRTLFVLDGLEPLQYPPGEMEGCLKDQGLQCLLKELAHHNPGLCIITTRLKVDDIKDDVGTSVKRIELEDLSSEAGTELLKNLGARGTDAELRHAVEDFGGHALSLTLLGTYVRVVYGGDIRQRGKIARLTDEKRQGAHARRVMKSYEKHFEIEGKTELSILLMMGLFDRPAEKCAIKDLRNEPTIEGLTSGLTVLSDGDWQYALHNLREAQLLAKEDPHTPGTLDSHPLIREHFAERLRKSNPKAWREAHSRLCDWYECRAKKCPNTIEEMVDSLAAIAHGCESGRHREMLNIYRNRIDREAKGGIRHFLRDKLGAVNEDLSTLSRFFCNLWEKPAHELLENEKAFVLSSTGLVLYILGRIEESVQPMKKGLEIYRSIYCFFDAAQSARHLSEPYLVMGRLDLAEQYSREGVDLANHDMVPGETDKEYYQIVTYSTLADVLHHTGQLGESECMFKKAESLQRQREEKHPFLCRIHGFRHFSLLLDLGDYKTVITRAKKTLKWKPQKNYPLGKALHRLALSYAHLLETLEQQSCDFSQAKAHIDIALRGLRQSGQPPFLILGILGQARLHIECKEYEEAQKSIDEAFLMAAKGGMQLYKADCHLEYARRHLAMGQSDEARKNLEIAGEMIANMGYHCREPELLIGIARLQMLDGKKDEARHTLEAAEKRIDEMGSHRWDIETKVLRKQLQD